MRFDNISREAWIGIFVLFLLALGESGFWSILLLIGILYFARNVIDNQQEVATNERPFRDSDDQERPQRPANTEQVHDHALDAVRAAGRDADNLPVLPVDIGVLAFKAEQTPVIHREWAVMDDIDYVQPFVQLRLPRVATGRIRFELLNGNNERLFVHEDDYQLERGRNLVVPAARLPIHDEQQMDGLWQLRIQADGMLLANHVFEWESTESARDEIREHIAEDGEISSELRAALAENHLQKMSLDELLSYQEEDDQEARSASST